MRARIPVWSNIRFGPILLLLLSLADACRTDETYTFVLGDADYLLDRDPDGESESAYECRSAYFVNRDRASEQAESDGAKPLEWDSELARVAETYSRDMCDKGFFDHVDPQGGRVGNRLSNAGVFWVKSGENLARGTYLQPEEVERRFMAEPPCLENHRGNILDNDFTHIGVGVVFCASTTYYTQIFATFDSALLRNDDNEYCTTQ